MSSTPRFFISKSEFQGDKVTITGTDAHHLCRVLRLREGDKITVCDMQKNIYDGTLTFVSPDTAEATLSDPRPSPAEPPYAITLYQGMPKGDKLETVIQKAVECGVCRIVPFESERCVVRMKPEAEGRKTERRNKIAHEAAKQCGRGILPEVLPTVSFDRVLEQAAGAHTVLFCYEGDGTLPIGQLLQRREIPQGAEIALVIGSEGGFSQKEAARAGEAGFLMTGLGPRILRTETAPLFALACLSYHFELTER